jgi:hypothetical protein
LRRRGTRRHGRKRRQPLEVVARASLDLIRRRLLPLRRPDRRRCSHQT